LLCLSSSYLVAPAVQDESMLWFFEDIRNRERRNQMVEIFWEILNNPSVGFSQSIQDNISSYNFQGIQHLRCWIVDLIARYLGVSHNELNRRIVAINCDYQSLGNPFNQISYKSERFMSDSSNHNDYAEAIERCFNTLLSSEIVDLAINQQDLANRLLILRLDGVIKLHKLNPLYLILESLGDELGLSCISQGTNSIISDLSRSNAVGKHEMFHISNGEITIVANAIAVHDHNGDHKSKEWGARRLATLYRYQAPRRGQAPQIQSSGIIEGLFIIDGEWEQRNINRLYRSGWNHIVRLGELEDKLKEIFS